MNQIVTDLGVFEQDHDGVFNYRYTGYMFGSVYLAISDAFIYRPKNVASCFWYGPIVAPIVLGDTVHTLEDRYRQWFNLYESCPCSKAYLKQKVLNFFDAVYAMP